MEHIHERVNKLLEASIAVNSSTVYKNAVANFSAFRKTYILTESWPSPVSHIVLFAAFCFEKGYSPSTITTYMSGISFWHKINNWQDPTELFIVKKILEGCRRSRRRCDNRAPITLPVLSRVVSALPVVCFSMYEEKTFLKLHFLLAYYGMLRVSELVFTTQLQANRPLRFNDLVMESNDKAVQIRIRFSKNKSDRNSHNFTHSQGGKG